MSLKLAATFPLIFLRDWILVLVLILGGCCSNVYTLEAIVKASPKSGNLITFAQFLVVSIDGLWKNLTFKSGWPSLAKRHIPIRHWLLIVSLFFTISVMNNYALGFHISMPLHIVFRSGSLMISMLVGYKYFGQTYSKHKISGVSIVTIGIILSTLSSSHHEASNAAGSYLEWVAGIGILSLGLVMSCFLGQYQQALYAKFGQQWQEGLFYTHLLSLPAFGLFYQDLINQVHIYNASEAMSIGMFLKPVLSGPMARQIWDILGGVYLDSVYVPSLWTFLVLNVTTQCELLLI